MININKQHAAPRGTACFISATAHDLLCIPAPKPRDGKTSSKTQTFCSFAVLTIRATIKIVTHRLARKSDHHTFTVKCTHSFNIRVEPKDRSYYRAHIFKCDTRRD